MALAGEGGGGVGGTGHVTRLVNKWALSSGSVKTPAATHNRGSLLGISLVRANEPKRENHFWPVKSQAVSCKCVNW